MDGVDLHLAGTLQSGILPLLGDRPRRRRSCKNTITQSVSSQVSRTTDRVQEQQSSSKIIIKNIMECTVKDRARQEGM